jgi:hypothetical protein
MIGRPKNRCWWWIPERIRVARDWTICSISHLLSGKEGVGSYIPLFLWVHTWRPALMLRGRCSMFLLGGSGSIIRWRFDMQTPSSSSDQLSSVPRSCWERTVACMYLLITVCSLKFKAEVSVRCVVVPMHGLCLIFNLPTSEDEVWVLRGLVWGLP